MAWTGNAYVTSVEEVDDLLSNLPLKDQKDLAEDILIRLYEKGYDVVWDYGTLTASKTEEL